MAESKPGTSAVASDAPPTVAEYKKSQQRVRELIERRRQLERHLVSLFSLLVPSDCSSEVYFIY